jgi:hypothetical protein
MLVEWPAEEGEAPVTALLGWVVALAELAVAV